MNLNLRLELELEPLTVVYGTEHNKFRLFHIDELVSSTSVTSACALEDHVEDSPSKDPESAHHKACETRSLLQALVAGIGRRDERDENEWHVTRV